MDMDMNMTMSRSDNMNLTMSSSDNMCFVMMNGYHFSPRNGYSNCILYLFPFSEVNTNVKYAFAVIGTFFLCMALEFLRAGRERMIRKKMPFHTTFFLNQSEATLDMINVISYGIQVWIGYWIMLLVMTYEATIFIAIVLGLSTGYFCVLRFNRSLDRQAATASRMANTIAIANGDGAGGGAVEKCVTTNEEEEEEDSAEDVTYNSATPCCGG